MAGATTFNCHLIASDEIKQEVHIGNLDIALAIIARVGILYNNLERSDKKELLRQMVERVVIDPEGTIIRLELVPPFAYLHDMKQRIVGGAAQGKAKTGQETGFCSSYVPYSRAGGTRTQHYLQRVTSVPHPHTTNISCEHGLCLSDSCTEEE